MPDDPHNPPAPLDYQSPHNDERRSKAHFMLGLVLTVLAVVGGVPLMILASLSQQANWPPYAFAAGGAALVIVAIVLTTQPRTRPFGIGMCAGFLVAALIEGLCFLAMRR